MLEEKVVVVTGAASGLGRATAHRLAELGGTVIVTDLGSLPHGEDSNEEVVLNTAEEISDAGGKAKAMFGDVTDENFAKSMVEEVVDTYGRVDGAVNYAGFLRDAMCFSMDLEDWRAVVSVHLDGHFNLIKHLADLWRSRSKAGEIDSQRSFVSISSASARGSASQINYSAAKAGILGFTRTAARELQQYDVRVNAIMPAAYTRMLEENVPEDVLENLPEDQLSPDKVVPLPLALLTEDAKDITGWTFAIAGNRVYSVSDPEFMRPADMEGGWTVSALGKQLDHLVGDAPRSKTEPGGLLGRILD